MAADRDLFSVLSPAPSIRSQSLSAALNGLSVDLRGFRGAVVDFDFGTIGGTSPSFTFRVQDSDDDVTFADVVADALQGGAAVFTQTVGNTRVRRGYLGHRRFVRAICSAVSGTGPTLQTSVGVIRGYPMHAPV